MPKSSEETETVTQRLDASDLAHHRFVIKRIEETQSLARWWSQMLADKYKLTPQDTVMADGEIQTRKVG